MNIDQFAQAGELAVRRGDASRPVGDLTDDSRRVTPGVVFLARAGVAGDGAAYIADAVRRGAAAVVTEPGVAPELPEAVAHLTAERLDQARAGHIAEAYFGRPSQKLRLVGVTGTNGKTTTAFLIQHLLRAAGWPTGLIGTIFVDPGDPAHRRPAELTTPGAIDFSRMLAEMVAHRCHAAVCETSSHALDQGRTAALRFDVGVFTNLTGDHLDYHGTMDAYAAAKAKLFESLPEKGWAVINADDPWAERIARDCRARRVWTTFGHGELDVARDGDVVCRGEVLELAATHTRARLDGPWGSLDLTLPLVGRHNVSNLLQAAAAANCLVGMARTLRTALPNCPNVPGRLERIDPPHDAAPPTLDLAPPSPATTATPASPRPAAHTPPAPTVLVDYAHSHDSLENALMAVRPVTRGRLIVLFGCGGDRDKTKRPKMAAVACRLADRVLLTSDNPRTEDPAQIIRDALTGVPAVKRGSVTVLEDRAEAIRAAVLEARADDTVLIAGKGHEDYQVVGTTRRPFDDREHARAALRTWLERHPADHRLSA